MEENNQNEVKKMENIMIDELKPVLKEFKQFEKEMKDIILFQNINMQEKIDNLMSNPLGITLDYSDGDELENEENTVSEETQQIIKEALAKDMRDKQDKKEQKINEEIEEKRKGTSEKCASIISATQKSIIENKKEIDKQLREVRKQLRPIKEDLKDIGETIKGAKPEGRAFKILDEQQKAIMAQKKELVEKENELISQKSEIQYDLQEFNNKYEKIDFLSESAIDDLLYEIYGEAIFSSDIILEEEEYEINKVQGENEQEEQVEDNKEQKEKQEEQGKNEQKEQVEEQKEQQEKNENREAEGTEKEEDKKKTQQQKETPQQTQKSPKSKAQNSKNTQVQGQNVKKQPKEEEPKIIYDAKKDSYIIITPKSDKPFGQRRASIENSDNKIESLEELEFNENITKADIANELEVTEEDLENVDMNIVKMWKMYDNIFETNEYNKYLKSILNPKENQAKQIEYDLTSIYGNRNITEADRQQILAYANFAKANKIADVKKGRLGSFIENIENRFKFAYTIREQVGRFGDNVRNVFNIIKNKDLKKIASDKLMSNISNSSIKEEATESKRRENTFKKETRISNKYNTISKEISEASKEDIDKILEKAKGDLKDGNISTTEYSGLIYNASNRRNTLNTSNLEQPEAKKEPVHSDKGGRG